MRVAVSCLSLFIALIVGAHADTECVGGQVFKACGSRCTKTCDNPSPMCTMDCVAKCECPSETPIWDEVNQSCITIANCGITIKAATHEEPVYDPIPPAPPAVNVVEPVPLSVEEEDAEEPVEEEVKRRFLLVNDNDDCLLRADPGPCKARHLRWYANDKTGDCERMFYGGCRGNANNFKSYDDCAKACLIR